MGFFAESERFGSYVDDVVTLSAMLEARPQLASVPGLSFRLRAIPQVLISTTDEDDFSFGLVNDSEVLIGYAAQAFFDGVVARVGGGLSGGQHPDRGHRRASRDLARHPGRRAARDRSASGPPRAFRSSVTSTGRWTPVIGVRLTYGVL